jgi:hypothetical protein
MSGIAEVFDGVDRFADVGDTDRGSVVVGDDQ